MTHVRQQIREAAAVALTGLATAGPRVFQSRLRPLKDSELPCLLVNTDEEEIEVMGMTVGAAQERTLRLVIRAVAKHCASLDDQLDAMLAEIEAALAGTSFGGLAPGVVLTQINIEMNDELEKPVGIASAHYAVTYYTATGSPGVVL